MPNNAINADSEKQAIPNPAVHRMLRGMPRSIDDFHGDGK
jgi:hypothetical protein